MENLNAYKQIRTVSGKYVNVFEPDLDTILIEDIAHALSMNCRFSGHLPEFYSVAQHSVLCSYYVSGDKNRFSALMHDASEAYLLDIARPIKQHLPDYKKIEDNLMNVIAKKFNFEYPKNKEVEQIDQFMLEREWNSIMLQKPSEIYAPIFCWNQNEAKNKFLEAFNTLK